MPVVIQGFTRLRKHQLGRQAAMGTSVAAVRAFPFSGTPAPDLKWTDPEGDFASLDPVAAPVLGVPDIGASLTIPTLDYNSLPALLCAMFGGAKTSSGAGTAKTWAHTPASETADAFDLFTYQFGDDVTTDWYQFIDGIMSGLTISGPVGLGAVSAQTTWRYGTVKSTGSTDFPVVGTVPTASLTVDRAPTPVYLKDMGIWIDSTAAGIGTTQVLNALHNFTLTISQEIDEKRFANASQIYDVSGYGRGARAISLECRFAKTTDTVGTGSESDAWMSDGALDRFVRLKFTSKALAETATPYSWQIDMPMRYYTREEDAEAGNSVVKLTAHAFLEATTFAGVLKSTAVTTQATV